MLELKLTVTPAGCPVADKATAELNPPETATVTVDEPLFPCTTGTEVGEAEMVKLGVARGVHNQRDGGGVRNASARAGDGDRVSTVRGASRPPPWSWSRCPSPEPRWTQE